MCYVCGRTCREFSNLSLGCQEKASLHVMLELASAPRILRTGGPRIGSRLIVAHPGQCTSFKSLVRKQAQARRATSQQLSSVPQKKNLTKIVPSHISQRC